MITQLALKNFEIIWQLFENKEKGMLDAGGAMFLVDPFEQFFSNEFAFNLTEESAHTHFHSQMEKWGQIEQNEHEIEIEQECELPDGKIFKKTRFKDPEVRWARNFIIYSFYNLACLATNNKTIEELIYIAVKDREILDTDGKDIKAFIKLIELSKSFQSAEWAKDIIDKATANNNEDFFNKLSKAVKKTTAKDKFDTAIRWIGVIMLWYLGGKHMKPRRNFMNLLQQMDIIPKSTIFSEESFRSMLYNLGLTKDLSASK